MKTKSTFFVGATGSFEEVTVKKWKRFRVLSHKSIGNLTNIADRVIGQRIAMAYLGRLVKDSNSVVRRGFNEYRLKRSWWPMFMSLNLVPAFDFTDPSSPVFVPTGLTVAKGSLGTTPMNNAEFSESTGLLLLEWNATVTPPQESYDHLCFILYNRRLDQYFSATAAGLRNGGGVYFNMQDQGFLSGDTLDIWSWWTTYFQTETGLEGNSSYITCVVSA